MALNFEIILKTLYSLGIGVLIALERSLIPPFSTYCDSEASDSPQPPELPDTILGVRTFSILSLGGFTAALAGSAMPSVAPVIVAGLIIMVMAMYFHVGKQDPGITTEISAIVCCGLADVDAIPLSIAEQTKTTQLAHHVGAVGITIAVVANSVVKSGIAVYSGGWKFGLRVGIILLGATGAGLAVLLFF